MAIPRSMGWLVVTGAVVLALMGLSFLALDKPDVVWTSGQAHCPHCRSAVPMYAKRCPTCREEFDWAPATDDDSPWCVACLAPAEDEALRVKRTALGDEAAAIRVSRELHITVEASKEYLKAVGRGQCGWCGGTGKDLAAAPAEARPCPVCFGEHLCLACGGDRRVRIGLESAGRELDRYAAHVQMLATAFTPPAAIQREIKGMNEDFQRRYAGTREASELLFWPQAGERGPTGDVLTPGSPRAVDMARQRLTAVLRALNAE